MNNLFNLLGNGNLMNLVSQIQSNPTALLRQKGFNVPDNLSNPQAIIQHLMNSGQVSQEQFNQARQMVQNLNIKI